MYNKLFNGKKFEVKGISWYSTKSDYSDGDDE
jgi:hypothetical protein